jgi:hypothetical protein
LLLFAGTNRFIRLSKISECAAAARPMLVFAARDSETARDVAAHGAVFPSDETPGSLSSAIVQVVRAGTDQPPGTAPFPFPHPHPLNRRTETSEFAELLNSIDRDPL